MRVCQPWTLTANITDSRGDVLLEEEGRGRYFGLRSAASSETQPRLVTFTSNHRPNIIVVSSAGAAVPSPDPNAVKTSFMAPAALKGHKHKAFSSLE